MTPGDVVEITWGGHRWKALLLGPYYPAGFRRWFGTDPRGCVPVWIVEFPFGVSPMSIDYYGNEGNEKTHEYLRTHPTHAVFAEEFLRPSYDFLLECEAVRRGLR